MSTPLQHGLTGGSPDEHRRRMAADDAAMRDADEQATQAWREKQAMKVKQTKGGPINRPATTDKASANIDGLGELLGDLAEAIREAQAREEVVSSASRVDPARFPSMRTQ